MPATLLGETVSHAQAQAGTVAFRLGGEKGSKACSMISAGMPMPVSDTASSTY